MRAIRIAGHLFHVDFEYILGCALNLPYLNGFSTERSNANGAGAIGLRLRCGGRTARSLLLWHLSAHVGAAAPKVYCGTVGCLSILWHLLKGTQRLQCSQWRVISQAGPH